MTAPRYVVADVPEGTSIRLELTADGWVYRGALVPLFDSPTSPEVWVDAPSTETEDLSNPN